MQDKLFQLRHSLAFQNMLDANRLSETAEDLFSPLIPCYAVF
jgi:hypothetical protein